MKKLLSIPKKLSRSKYNVSKACHFLSNEFYSPELLVQIGKTDGKAPCSRDVKTAIVFGESHWISILPELSKRGCRALILADINPLSLKLFEYMKRNLEASPTIGEFKFNMLKESGFNKKDVQLLSDIETKLEERVARFKENAQGDLVEQCRSLSNFLINMLFQKVASGEFHFLSSKERFNECKRALIDLEIKHVKLNILDKRVCEKFAEELFHENKTISLLNLTNIADYDSERNLRRSISSLLGSSEADPLIMCSTAKSPRVCGRYQRIKSVAVNSVQDYFKYNGL